MNYIRTPQRLYRADQITVVYAPESRPDLIFDLAGYAPGSTPPTAIGYESFEERDRAYAAVISALALPAEDFDPRPGVPSVPSRYFDITEGTRHPKVTEPLWS